MPLPTIPAWVPPLDTGQPSAQDLNDLGTLPKANFAAANQVIPITYGRDRLFGQPFVVHVDEDLGHLYLAYSFCEGQINGFEKILIDGDEALVTGKAYVGLKNRGFESGDNTGWTEVTGQDGTVNLSVAQTGDYGINIPTLSGGRAHFSDRMIAPPEGTKIRLKGWAQRNTSPDGNATIAVYESATAGGTLTATDTGNYADIGTGFNQANSVTAGWQPFDLLWTVPAGVAEYSFRLGANAGTVGSWDFDDMSTEVLADDDTSISADAIELVAYVGTQTQYPDSLLASSLTGYADTCTGLAYIVARVPKDATRGFPRLEAIVQGRLVYDPRKDGTAGSNGPQLTFTRTGTAWFRDWEGLYRAGGTDEPRFDGARRVENLSLSSEEMEDTGSWTKNSVTITPNAAIAPDGTLTADKIVSVLVTGRIGLTMPAMTVLADKDYTHSVYLKAAEWTLATLFIDSATALPSTFYGSGATIDLIAGTADVPYINMTDAGDGWWRCDITGGDTTTSAVFNVVMQDPTNPGVNSVVGDGVSGLYMWGRQTEFVHGQADQTASEYLKTEATVVNRTFNTDRQGNVLVGSRTVTNEVLDSDCGTGWGATNLTNVDSGLVMPSQFAQNFRLLTVTGTSQPRAEENLPVPAVDTDYIFSVHVKRGNTPYVGLSHFSESTCFAIFNLDTGTVISEGTTNFLGAGIDFIENGTYRIWMALTVDAVSAFSIFKVNMTDGAVVTDGIIGDTCYIGAGQIEQLNSRVPTQPWEYVFTDGVATSATYTVDLNGEDLPGGRGLMIEMVRTNFADGSNGFLDASTYWDGDANFTAITAVASVFPDQIAYEHEDDGAANRARAQNNGTFTDGETSVLSVILENVDATLFDVGIRDVTSSAWVNLLRMNWGDLTVSQTFGINGTHYVEDLGIGPNGGQLVRMTVTAVGTAAGTGATGNTRSISTYPSGGPTNTDKVIIHHAQFEDDVTFPTSPIVTPDASDVTRNAESMNAVNADWLNHSAGSIYWSGSIDQVASPDNMLFSIDIGTTANRVQAITNSSGTRLNVASGGAVQADLFQTNTLQDYKKFHYGAAWQVDDVIMYTNGIASAADTLATMPVGMDRVVIGNRTPEDWWLNGFCAEFRYYNTRQPNTWLESATKGDVYDNAPNLDESLTLAFNFARDMSIQAAGNVGGVGAHRVDDVTTWEFSQNPTLCFRDTVENFTGWDILDAGVIDNANANDEIISGVPRRQVGLTLARANTVASWMKGHRAYMGAFLNWESGKIRVIPNRPDVEAPGAIVGDGVDAEVDMGDVTLLDFDATSDFTIEFMFKALSTASTQAMVCKKDDGTGLSAPGYSCMINSAGLVGMWYSDGTTQVFDSLAGPYDDGEWHHFVGRVNRATEELEVAIDNVWSGSAADTTSVGSVVTGEQFRLLGDETANFFNGSIDEVRVWNTARTDDEITNNMLGEISNPYTDVSLIGYWKLNEASSATMAIDSSGNGNDGTLLGAAVFSTGYQQVIPDGVAMHIGVDDIVKDSMKLQRRSLRSVPNSVAIDYEDSSGTRWFTARTQADSVRVTNGDEARRLSRVSLPGIHNASQAQREAVERLNWYLTDLECKLTLFDTGWNLTHGSIVAVTHPIGLDAKLFRVRQTTAVSGRWTVDLVEYDPAIYSDSVVADPTIPDTNLGDPLNPPTVTNLVLAEELFNYRTGTTGSRVRISWNATTFPFLSQYLVEGWVAGVKVWQTTTAANDIVTPGVEEIVDTIGTPTDYEVRVYVQSPFASGAAAIDNVQIDGKFAIPGDPTGAVATQTFADEVDLTWAAAVDIDIWRYEVRRGTTSDTWATATSLVFLDGLSYTDTGLALGTHRYFIKAIDSVKQESNAAAQVDVTLSAPVAVAGLFGFEVASEVRLNWAAVSSGFVERYRIAYSDIPETFETTLDVVDTIRFQTKDVPEGTFTFKAYSVDKVGNEAATAATVDIEVTSDADAFLADTYDFVQATTATPSIVTNGTLTNMVEWGVRLDDLKYYVTNMADSFAVSPTDFVAADPLANYHSTGASLWLSETKDFGLPLTGSWNLAHDTVSLQGNIDIALELSTDNITFVSFGGSAKGEYQYARVRISTVASPGTATAFAKSPLMNLKINVVPLEESGSSVSSPNAGVGDTVNLSREYTALKEITTQPKNTIATGSAVTSIVDNIVIGPNTAIQCDGTNYYVGADWAELDFAGDFTIEYITRHTGSSGVDGLICGKRNGSGAGWSVYQDYNTQEIDFRIDDSVNVATMLTTGNGIPNDGEMHHIAIVVDRGADTVSIYTDSVINAASPHDISVVTGSLASAVAFNIFATNTGTNIHEANGLVDQLRIWSVAKTQPQIEASYNIALDMTQTQTGLVHYQLCDGGVGVATGDITDVTTNARTLTETGAGSNTFVDPGNTGPNVQKINSFDVFIFDTFGQQLAEQYQWKWKAV